ncbi:MAG: FG-GAP repeat protein [Puniceicoccales bacterium]|jgi:hypothetical protein|nr:FG-GAP repeat protein [Puniceicoccales bacterium]
MKTHSPNSLSPAFARATCSAKLRIFDKRFLVLAAASLVCLPTAQGAILIASDPDPVTNDLFGSSVGISGTTAIVGAYVKDSQRGAAYIYTGVDSGTPTEILKLTASDRAEYDQFGYFNSAGISGTIAIVGAYGKEVNPSILPKDTGAAYIYTGVGSNDPIETKLTASDAAHEDNFGWSVGISGTTAIVGAYRKDSNKGAVYVYTGVDSVTPTQKTKLIATDAVSGAQFGYSVGISGTTAIVGAYGNQGSPNIQGAAYIYTGVGSDNPIEKHKLTASDGAVGDGFGCSVGISGTTAIVGARAKDSNAGAAYIYTGVGSDNPTQTKLTASDNPAEVGYFGNSVGISGTTAIIGAFAKDSYKGAAYFYTGVDSGTPTEILKLSASDGVSGDSFGRSVSVDGDNFIVGANYAASRTVDGTVVYGGGRAYVGQVSTFTTVNVGNVTRLTEGLSFVSKTDWIIGDTTSDNTVILSKFKNVGYAWHSDIATVTATGKAVYIGKSASARSNTLVVEGILRTNKIYIGSANGANNNTLIVSANASKGGTSGQIKADEIYIGSESSHGNVLQLEGAVSVALVAPTTVWLHRGNMLIIQEIHAGAGPEGEDLPLTPTEAVTALAGVQLKAGWLPDSESSIIAANAEQLISTSTSPDMPGYTIVLAAGSTPEPSTYALWGSSLLAGLVFLRRRRRRKG